MAAKRAQYKPLSNLKKFEVKLDYTQVANQPDKCW